MRVVQEPFTVVPYASQREVAILLAGMRVSFSIDEARHLATELSRALQVVGREAPKKLRAGIGLSEAAVTELGSAKADLKTAG